MVKSQKIIRHKQKCGPIVIDERIEPKLSQEMIIDPAIMNAPVRTVNFVEVGDMSPTQLQLIIQRLNKTHDTAKGGIHYFLPIRHGKIGSDIVFEKEFEAIGHKIFEVIDNDGKVIENANIKLKGGAKEVVVIRRQI